MNDNKIAEEEVDLRDTVRDTFSQNGIYLSGPIRNLDDNGSGWREEIIEEYSDDYDFLSPLDHFNPAEVEILHDPINFDEDAEKEQIVPSEYVSDDKMQISKSDCMFVGLPDVITTGTKMECGWAAWVAQVPIFVWAMDGQTVSGWIYDHAEFISDDREEVFDEVERWYK